MALQQSQRLSARAEQPRGGKAARCPPFTRLAPSSTEPVRTRSGRDTYPPFLTMDRGQTRCRLIHRTGNKDEVGSWHIAGPAAPESRAFNAFGGPPLRRVSVQFHTIPGRYLNTRESTVTCAVRREEQRRFSWPTLRATSVQRCLTLRSTGPATASAVSPGRGTWCIIASQAYSGCLRRPDSTNVRRHKRAREAREVRVGSRECASLVWRSRMRA